MIFLYSKENCPQCEMAAKLLSLKSIPFTTQKLGVDFTSESLAELNVKSKSFPIVFKDGIELGGFKELRAALLAGTL